MSTILRIDQVSRPNGTNDRSRSDGVKNQVVTLRSLGAGTTHTFTLLAIPSDDTNTLSSWSAGSTTATFTPNGTGTYLIRLTVDGVSVRRGFAIKTANGLRKPAPNERSNPNVTLATQADAGSISACDFNENDDPYGWMTSFHEVIDAVAAAGAGDALSFRGRAVSATVPTDGQVYAYVAGSTSWVPTTISGGAGGLSGTAAPEGSVTGSVGQTYTRTGTGQLYIKLTGSGNTGWYEAAFIAGSGSPETVVSAAVGRVYVRTDNGALYTKTSGSGNTGWSLHAFVTDLPLTGSGTPEAAVTATVGRIFVRTDNGQLYTKITGSGNTGWSLHAFASESPLYGSGSPEGVTTATVGRLYARTDTGALYTKTTGSGNTGWSLVAFETGLLLSGSGAPEGVVSAAVGKVYIDTTTGLIYSKFSGGSGNTGWSRQALVTEAILSNMGSPEGATTAGVGRLFTRFDTGQAYVKTSGSGNTGWTRLLQVGDAPVAVAGISGNNTLTASQERLRVDTAMAAILTLPSAVSNPGKQYQIKKVTLNTNTITMRPQTGEQVEFAGASTDYLLPGSNTSARLSWLVSSNGTQWDVD